MPPRAAQKKKNTARGRTDVQKKPRLGHHAGEGGNNPSFKNPTLKSAGETAPAEAEAEALPPDTAPDAAPDMDNADLWRVVLRTLGSMQEQMQEQKEQITTLTEAVYRQGDVSDISTRPGKVMSDQESAQKEADERAGRVRSAMEHLVQAFDCQGPASSSRSPAG